MDSESHQTIICATHSMTYSSNHPGSSAPRREQESSTIFPCGLSCLSFHPMFARQTRGPQIQSPTCIAAMNPSFLTSSHPMSVTRVPIQAMKSHTRTYRQRRIFPHRLAIFPCIQTIATVHHLPIPSSPYIHTFNRPTYSSPLDRPEPRLASTPCHAPTQQTYRGTD
jgi:hypothetical protein